MVKKIILLVIILLVIILFNVLDIDQYLDTDYLIDKRDVLLETVDENFVVAILTYIVLYIIAVTFSFPGASVLSIAGGLLFGLLPGLLAVNISATSGASLNFIFARYVFGESFQKKYGDKVEGFNREIEANGKNYLLTLRLIPVFPFFLINILAGLTKVTLKTFVWTTSLGIIPGSIFFVYAGTTLQKADSVKDFATWQTTLPLVILGIVAVLPVIYQKVKNKND